MSYTPTTWATGDVITAEKLNNMESGIENAGGGGGVLIATITENNGSYSCDKTSEEIKKAMDAGVPAFFKFSEGNLHTEYYLCSDAVDEDEDVVIASRVVTMANLTANSFYQTYTHISLNSAGGVSYTNTRYTVSATQG